jgi:hypothetical protein
MDPVAELEKERSQILKKCQDIKEKLKDQENPTIFARMAQEANDLWVNFRKKEIEATNQLVMKRIGDLYGG